MISKPQWNLHFFSLLFQWVHRLTRLT
jgi:hypothetical protein